MSGLRVDHVAVRYPGASRLAVADAHFTVASGEILGLVGPSGCGKSTLLGAIAGIVDTTHGRVVVDDVDISAMAPHRRGIGLVFQDGQLFPHRTVAGNIGFGLEMTRVPGAQVRDRVRELLAVIDLEGFEDQPVSRLSGGERQRVALARSLAPRPRVMLLDEPLSSLDADLRERLGLDVRRILASEGTTAVVVTHDVEEARRMCDSTIRMADGVVSDAETPDGAGRG